MYIYIYMYTHKCIYIHSLLSAMAGSIGNGPALVMVTEQFLGVWNLAVD